MISWSSAMRSTFGNGMGRTVTCGGERRIMCSFVMVSFGFVVGFLVCSSCWASTDEGVRLEVLCVV